MFLLSARRLAAPAAVFASVLLLAGVLPTEAAPKARVEPETLELGFIEEGHTFERFLEVHNDGDEVLILERIDTSCGCTAAAVEGNSEVLPGESRQVRVAFDSKSVDGSVTKKVTIVTNDPEMAHHVVRLNAEVHMPVKWDPKYIMLDRVSGKDEIVREVKLLADTDLGLRVTGSELMGGRLHDRESSVFDFEQSETVREGDRDAVTFTLRMRPGLGPQRISDILFAYTNIAGRDTMKVPIRGEVSGRIEVDPASVFMRTVDSGQETMREIYVTASEGEFRILGVERGDLPVQVEVDSEEPGSSIMVRIYYLAEKPGTRGQGNITILTDDPVQGRIDVPVRYRVRGTARQ
ncbi:MAG: DUF1573 domain-containing protein [Gemmatimonadota bacterium]|jgi:hypothetical protein|nr:DUF1573 domain-containing protein [Gemmatimonadota bacterium]